ncbi:hypothetical protein AWJ20_4978 [Sugiyamaella lignohabitans]|uniref:Biogenesis of lysosome-related organelles complex 1 subunit KXD1 n=1 Tax=Sugiyamaella lignohabitans TaxID=796027 RepID=A0A167EFN7_9ASCO|nr:uncharacterized protein AWJ20_4978 [Sugiyamaella lignohabitans]ANB14022.1 hypothetical protein AWJ20_4978 [Sugiyamaella lignohabitans]
MSDSGANDLLEALAKDTNPDAVQSTSSRRQLRRRNSLTAATDFTSSHLGAESSSERPLALIHGSSSTSEASKLDDPSVAEYPESYLNAADEVSSLSSFIGSDESSSDSELSPVQLLSDLMTNVFDPSSLDRVVVLQAQSSGMVHAKTREVQQLHLQATARLEEIKQTFSQDLKAAKQLVKDLEWTQRRLAAAIKKAKVVYPIEYAQAVEKIKP